MDWMAVVDRLASCMSVLRRVPGAYVSKQRTALTLSKKKTELLIRDTSQEGYVCRIFN